MKELREVIEGTKFTLGLGNRELGQHLGFGRRYIDKVLREGVTTQKQIELIERINQLDNGVGFNEIDDSDKIKGLEHQVVMLQKDNDYFVKTNAELRKHIGVAVKGCGKVRIENGELVNQLQGLYADLSDKSRAIAEKHRAWFEQLGVSEKLRDQLKEKDEVIGS